METCQVLPTTFPRYLCSADGGWTNEATQTSRAFHVLGSLSLLLRAVQAMLPREVQEGITDARATYMPKLVPVLACWTLAHPDQHASVSTLYQITRAHRATQSLLLA
eukprot:5918550-Amphidinium_carterae.1